MPMFRILRTTPLLATALFIGGCAQLWGNDQAPDASSKTEAQYQAQNAGYGPVTNAPSQVQIDLTPGPAKQPLFSKNRDGETAVVSADAARRAFLPQAQTYAGAMPCLTPSAQCQAQRVVLTLGPNGHWRSRATAYADTSASGSVQTSQGCWDIVDDKPTRLLLRNEQGNALIDLTATANNVLRVRSVLGRPSTLTHTLTRQPDLDPIAELDGKPSLTCE